MASAKRMAAATGARIGVVTFPGTLDDRDAARAVRLAGAEAVALWHADDDLQGVDAVVPLTAGAPGEDDTILIGTETRLFQNVRRAGSELSDGTPLLRAGDVLTPRSVAVLAEVGLDKVMVRPRPRVVVFTVGETLVEPGRALTAPQKSVDRLSGGSAS